MGFVQIIISATNTSFVRGFMYRNVSFRRSIQFAILILISSSVFATDDFITEHSYLQELPVVLTASRLSQPLSESPSSMTIIDRQMINASGFRSVVELFRLVPGMYVGNAGANTPFVSLNGVTDQFSRRMQVLVDGRSVYLPPFGGVEWNGLPLSVEDIERIEVVRGPSAASHGTNSFYGVINILTKDPSIVDTDRLTLTKGDMGITNVSAQHGRTEERLDYRLSYSYRADNGDNPEVLNDSSSNRILAMRSNFRVNSNDTFEFQLGLNMGEAGKGTKGQLEKDPFRTVSTRNDFQMVAWRHSWDSGDESKLAYYRINRNSTDPLKAINWNVNPTVFGADISKSSRQDIEIQNTTQLWHDNRVVWGGGLRYDFAEQPLIFSTIHGLNQSRVFVHDEWRPIESTVLNIGTMLEDDGAGHKNNSPRVSVNYHIQPQHTLRASFATATRNPVMAEMYLTAGKNQYWSRAYVPPKNPLSPERITSKEIGYVGHFGQWSLDGRVYYEKVRDIVGLDFYADLSNLADPKSSFKNLTDGIFKGIEVSADYRWVTGRVNLNYARQQASCHFSSYPTQYFNALPISATQTLAQMLAQAYQSDYLGLCSESVPVNSASILLNQRLSETVDFSTGYYFRDRVRVNDVYSALPAESPMHRVDIRLAKEFGQKERPGGGEIAVVLQNVFQDNYTAYGNVQQVANLLFKRRAYLTASVYF
ncbi:MAG: iron complex outermembrane recepter protein [Gallionellaceae bacterium]|nr:MAG: iron complex outermembrane recepter protein [Gallionellaceae bacterium]